MNSTYLIKQVNTVKVLCFQKCLKDQNCEYLIFKNGLCQLYNLNAVFGKITQTSSFIYVKTPCRNRWLNTVNTNKFFQRKDSIIWYEYLSGNIANTFTQTSIQDGGDTVVLKKADNSLITVKKDAFYVSGNRWDSGIWSCKKKKYLIFFVLIFF